MRRLLVFALVFALEVTAAFGATYTVTNTNDSGPGSLRQAILDANANPNSPADQPDRIHFNIPGVNVHTIAPLSSLPPLSDAVVIDGYTQPGTSRNTLALGTDAQLRIELSGNLLPASSGVHGIAIQASNCTLRGLVVNRFPSDGLRVGVTSAALTSTRISGCYIGTNAAGSAPLFNGRNGITLAGGTSETLLGGTAPADRNVIAAGTTTPDSTPRIAVRAEGPGPAANTIQGNYIGLQANGSAFTTGAHGGISLSNSNNNLVGGSTVEARNVVGGGVSLFVANENVIRGNFMGTDATGRVAIQNGGGFGTGGFLRLSTPQNCVGNSVIGNVISPLHNGAAVALAFARANIIASNFIGVASDGLTPVGTTTIGVYAGGGGDTIGGTAPGSGNVIAFSKSSFPFRSCGVMIEGSGERVIGNSIHSNEGLGIDIIPAGTLNPEFGVTPNDLRDEDTGRNGHQNYPILSSVTFSGSNVRLTGTLNSHPNETYRIELFGNQSSDPKGYGEGEFYLGFTEVTTDASGNASFDLTLPRPQNVSVFSSTATGAEGTSEFGPTFLGRLQNISTRARVQTGDYAMIAGVIVRGAASKKVIMRAIGPSMEISGVPFVGRLEDPVLDLYDANGVILARNDNWRETQQSEIEQSGIPPKHDRESAIVRALLPGNYTAVMTGKSGATGVGLVEAYDLDLGAPSNLANISTRAFVETGENAMIGGFIVGPGEGGARILFRALGPSLSTAGISGVMQDPVIEVRDYAGAVRATNDDWKQNQAQVEATGAAPGDDRESAVVADLPFGPFTVILRGKAGTTGVALVELYHLQ